MIWLDRPQRREHDCSAHLGPVDCHRIGDLWRCDGCGRRWELALLPGDPGRLAEGQVIVGPDRAQYWRAFPWRSLREVVWSIRPADPDVGSAS